MYKYLLIVLVVILGLIHFGNYIDHKKGRIDKKEYDRRIRIFFILFFIVVIILFWLRRKF